MATPYVQIRKENKALKGRKSEHTKKYGAFMSEQIENIESQIIELNIINSNAYYIFKIIGIIIGIIGALIAGAILSRGASTPFIDRYIELPLWASLLLYIFTLILLGISVSLQCNKN